MGFHIFQDGEKFYGVELCENGEVILKVKENGWSDIWSLPVKKLTQGDFLWVP